MRRTLARLDVMTRTLAAAVAVLLSLGSCAPAPRHYDVADTNTEVDASVDAADACGNAPRPYPAGPYGISVGQTFPNLCLEGYRRGTGAWTHFEVADYWDADGSKNVNALMINASAAWCPPCNHFAAVLDGLDAELHGRGAQLTELMVDSPSTDLADQKTVDDWLKKYSLDIDTVFETGHVWLNHATPDFGFPAQFFLDPRTMVVIRRSSGDDADLPRLQLEAILEANGSPNPDAGTGD